MIHTITEKLGEFAILHGCLHEPFAEMDNVSSYPSVLIIPGGGFRECSVRESEPVAMAYFAEGFQAFYLEYTTVTDKPEATIADPMDDVQKAFAFLEKLKKEFFMEDHKLALLGFSGGAHLAAAAATHGPRRPDLLLLGYAGILHSDLRALECRDILESVDGGTPATFLFSTRDDSITPPKHTLAFANKLDQHNVDFEMHIFRTGVHGLSLATAITSAGDKNMVNPIFAQWFKMSIDWLKGKWGEFTIYGVNDGRNGRFSIDSTIVELMSDERAFKILMQYMANAKEIAKTPFGKAATPRYLQKKIVKIAEVDLKNMDIELLKLV